MMKVNFTNANEAKTEIIESIGDTSLAITNTFAEISNKLIEKKQKIVNSLNNKNIIASQSEDIEKYADYIDNIVQNSKIKKY
jgi:hypothetical protein